MTAGQLQELLIQYILGQQINGQDVNLQQVQAEVTNYFTSADVDRSHELMIRNLIADGRYDVFKSALTGDEQAQQKFLDVTRVLNLSQDYIDKKHIIRILSDQNILPTENIDGVQQRGRMARRPMMPSSLFGLNPALGTLPGFGGQANVALGGFPAASATANQANDSIGNFSSFKESLSNGRSLYLFSSLVEMLLENPFDKKESKASVVLEMVNSVTNQRTFNKAQGVEKIDKSLEDFIGLMQNYLAGQNQMFAALMLQGQNKFFPQEILNSFSADKGLQLTKELLGRAGINGEAEKNNYIKDFVKNCFIEGFYNNDKADKLNYYLRAACNQDEAEIFNNKILIFDEAVSRQITNTNFFPNLKKEYLDYLNKKTELPTANELQKLIVYFDGIAQGKKFLTEKGVSDDQSSKLVKDAVVFGADQNNSQILRTALAMGNKQLLCELLLTGAVAKDAPAIFTSDQLYAAINVANQQNQFFPIRKAFAQNSDESRQCLVFVFSKLSDNQKEEVLNNLLPNFIDAQGQPARNFTFLEGILRQGNFESAKLILGLFEKYIAVDGGNVTKQACKKLLGQNQQQSFAVSAPDNNIAILSMIVDSGFEANADNAIKTGYLSELANSSQILLRQSNPASTALFFDLMDRVGVDKNQEIAKLEQCINRTFEPNQILRDEYKNPLIFLLEKNPQNQDLQNRFARFLPDNADTRESKALIKAVVEAVFSEKEGEVSVAKKLQEVGINPHLEAGKIFNHLDDQKTKDLRKNSFEALNAMFGRLKVREVEHEVPVLNREGGTARYQGPLDEPLNNMVARSLLGYDVAQNNPLLPKQVAQDLSFKINESLSSKGVGFTAYHPTTNVAATQAQTLMQQQVSGQQI